MRSATSAPHPYLNRGQARMVRGLLPTASFGIEVRQVCAGRLFPYARCAGALLRKCVVGMSELPQRTPMKKRCIEMILEMTVKKPCTTATIYEAMNEKWPHHAPKKMTVARYCNELQNRGFLVREDTRKDGQRTKRAIWRYKTKRDFA